MPLPLRDVPGDSDLASVMRTAGIDNCTSIRTVLTLFRISRDLYAATERFFASHGVSDGKWSILVLLRFSKRRGMQPSELAEKLAVTRGTITGILKGLERDGYVSRRAHQSDGRRDLIALTRKGSRLLVTMMPELAARHEASMAALSDQERRTLVRLLEGLNVP